jgi:hypothetical protein
VVTKWFFEGLVENFMAFVPSPFEELVENFKPRRSHA